MSTVVVFQRRPEYSLTGRLFGGAATLRPERPLAVARVLLASSLLVGVHFDRAIQHGDFSALSSPLILYVVYSFLVLAVSLARKGSGSVFGLSTHIFDVLWPLALYLAIPEQRSLCFVLLVLFALLAAAYRWGFWETLATAVASDVLLILASAVGRSWSGQTFLLPSGKVASGSIAVGAVGVIALGAILGYLIEREKRRRVQTLVLSRILQQAGVEASLNETFEATLCAVLTLFHARRVGVALKEIGTQRAYLWEAAMAVDSAPVNVRHCEIERADEDRYFFEAPGESWYFRPPRGHAPGRWLALGANGHRLHPPRPSMLASICSGLKCRSILATRFLVGTDWSGRLFVFDPAASVSLASELQLLRKTVQQAAPALHRMYLLRRLRSRARADERARIAADLHDGVIQTLSAMEMRLELLRCRAAGDATGALAEEIGDLQELVRHEILGVRELMQKFKFRDLSPSQLLSSLADLVDRFERETGISARFAAELNGVPLPARECRAVALIVLEGLANVRKHSAARHVSVRLGFERDSYQLLIQDDGRGFDFTGRLSLPELSARRKGPKVLMGRVQAINGGLVIESAPGKGARIEIRLPQ